MLRATASRDFEDAALASGVASPASSRVPASEKGMSVPQRSDTAPRPFAEKLTALNVTLIVCVLRYPAKVLLGSGSSPGIQAKVMSWSAHVCGMPGPYDKRENVVRVMDELRHVPTDARCCCYPARNSSRGSICSVIAMRSTDLRVRLRSPRSIPPM